MFVPDIGGPVTGDRAFLTLRDLGNSSNSRNIGQFNVGGIYFRQVHALCVAHKFDGISNMFEKTRFFSSADARYDSGNSATEQHASSRFETFLRRYMFGVKIATRSALWISSLRSFPEGNSVVRGINTLSKIAAREDNLPMQSWSASCPHPIDLPPVHSRLLHFILSINTRKPRPAQETLHRCFDYLYAVSSRHVYLHKRQRSQNDIPQYAVLNLAALMFHLGHLKACHIATHEALRVAQQRHDDTCVTAASSWLRYISLHFQCEGVTTKKTGGTNQYTRHCRKRFLERLKYESSLGLYEDVMKIHRSRHSSDRHHGTDVTRFLKLVATGYYIGRPSEVNVVDVHALCSAVTLRVPHDPARLRAAVWYSPLLCNSRLMQRVLRQRAKDTTPFAVPNSNGTSQYVF